MNDLRSAAADADWQYRARERHAEAGTLPPTYFEPGWHFGRVASRHGLTYFAAEWLELSPRERRALADENGNTGPHYRAARITARARRTR